MVMAGKTARENQPEDKANASVGNRPTTQDHPISVPFPNPFLQRGAPSRSIQRENSSLVSKTNPIAFLVPGASVRISLRIVRIISYAISFPFPPRGLNALCR